MSAPPLASLLEDPVLLAVAEVAAPLPTHLVGGRLRDHRLGIESHDVDVVVAGTAERSGLAVAEALAERLAARLVLLGGHDFAAYRLVRHDLTLDVWDRAGASLESDLARRDLTVNAVALALTGEARGRVVDPHGGLGDLDLRLLRAVTPASFSGDPLRVLRLPRFLVQLPGFRAHPSTLDLAHRAAPDLGAVAAERVREELDRIFAHDERGTGLATLAALDLYPGLFVGRPGEPGTAGDAVAEVAALPDAMAHVAELAAGLRLAFDPPVARLASALHHLRSVPPLPALTRLREAGYVTRRVAERARPLLDWPRPPASEVESRHFLHHQGELWATATALLGARADAAPDRDAAAWEATARRLVDLVEREGDALLDPPRLLGGAEIQELLGISPGPEVGRALATVRAAQIEGRIRTREEAEELLRRRLRTPS